MVLKMSTRQKPDQLKNDIIKPEQLILQLI